MIGELRENIQLIRPSRTPDEAGGASVTWLAGPQFWARVVRLTSTRNIIGDRARLLRRIAVTIRKRMDVIAGERIRFNNDEYEIVSIEDAGEDDRRLRLICEEVV